MEVRVYDGDLHLTRTSGGEGNRALLLLYEVIDCLLWASMLIYIYKSLCMHRYAYMRSQLVISRLQLPPIGVAVYLYPS